MDLSDAELAHLLARLEPVIESLIAETIEAAFRRHRQMGVSTATVVSVNGDEAIIVPDDDPNEVTVLRVGTGHDAGSRVFVLHWPPAGAFITPPIPEGPTGI